MKSASPPTRTASGWTALQQTELHRWDCLKTDTAVEVQFRFTAAQLNAGSTWADDALLYVNPVNCLPYHPALEDAPVEVNLPDIPHTWSLATAPQVFVRPSRRDPVFAHMFFSKDLQTILPENGAHFDFDCIHIVTH